MSDLDNYIDDYDDYSQNVDFESIPNEQNTQEIVNETFAIVSETSNTSEITNETEIHAEDSVSQISSQATSSFSNSSFELARK